MKPSIHDGVLFGADGPISDWVHKRLPGHPNFGPCAALGIVRDGQAVGGVVFHSYRAGAGDIEVAGAVDPGFRIGPAGLRRVLRYAFVQLGCTRVTIRTAKGNKVARRFAERLGFQLEGMLRHGFDGRQHLVVYGLLARECRFLKETH